MRIGFPTSDSRSQKRKRSPTPDQLDHEISESQRPTKCKMADVEMTDAAAAGAAPKIKSSKASGDAAVGEKKRFEVKKVRCQHTKHGEQR